MRKKKINKKKEKIYRHQFLKLYVKASKSEPSSCVILWLWCHHWNKSSAAITLTIFRIPWVSLPLDSSFVFISLNNYEAVSEDLERCLDWELRLIIHRNHLDILPLRSMPRLALLLFFIFPLFFWAAACKCYVYCQILLDGLSCTIWSSV